MILSSRSNTIATGLAMFAMFFGAGNITFPLLLGQVMGDENIYAVSGMLMTAVLMPIVGLMAMVLYQGNYEQFFYRVGKTPGFLLIILSLVLLGPLCVIPRAVTLTHAIFDYTVLPISLWSFSAIACLVIFIFAAPRGKVLDLVAYFLTPLLLLFLATIVIKGLLTPGFSHASGQTGFGAFLHGMLEGYNTLDLISGLFFSTLIVLRIHEHAPPTQRNNPRYLVKATFKASLVGGGLLALVYMGMSFVTALHGTHPFVAAARPDQLIGAISLAIMGQQAGIIAVLATGLACLTTAISLTVIFAEFLQKHIFKHKINYLSCVVLTLLVTFGMSLLSFAGIMKLILPVLIIFYPVFIVLSLFNIGHKLFGLEMIKLPLILTFVASLSIYLW
ncbi:MAG: branched-chain amino acid transport system II carrier protein [Gammaproteobacteria bacterium]